MDEAQTHQMLSCMLTDNMRTLTERLMPQIGIMSEAVFGIGPGNRHYTYMQ